MSRVVHRSRALGVNPKFIKEAEARDKTLAPDCRPEYDRKTGEAIWKGDSASVSKAHEKYAHRLGLEVP